MSKAKILYITHAYYNKGGVEEHVRDLCKGLSKFFECYILTPVQTGAQQHYQLIKNGNLRNTFTGNNISGPMSPLKDNAAIQAFDAAVKKVTPDVIHIHHLQNWPLELLENICKTNIPTLFTLHDYFLATPLFTMEFSEHPRELLTKEYAEKIFGKDISEYLRKRRQIFTTSLNQMKHLITPSLSTKIEMTRIIPSEYKVIPHGISQFNKQQKQVSEKIRFGFVGSIIRQKGWKSLVQAFEQAFLKNKNIELHIFGGGYEANDIPRIENITYHGSYTKKDLPQILSQIDVGIIPSIFKETFCYTKAEMQSAGLPLIVSNIGALPENITDSSGMIFEAGNVEDLKRTILRMAETFKKTSWEIPAPRTLSDMCNDYKQMYESLR